MKEFFSKLEDIFTGILGIAMLIGIVIVFGYGIYAFVVEIIATGIDEFFGYVLLYGISSGTLSAFIGLGLFRLSEILDSYAWSHGYNSVIINKRLYVIGRIVYRAAEIVVLPSLLLAVGGGFLFAFIEINVWEMIANLIQPILFGEESISFNNAINRLHFFFISLGLTPIMSIIISIATYLAWWIGVISGILQIYEFFSKRKRAN